MGTMNLMCISLAAEGVGISGGDRIWIELVHRWSRKINVTVYTSQAGLRMFKEFQNNNKIQFIVYPKVHTSRIIDYINKSFWGIQQVMKTTDYTYIFSASEFIPDIFPAIFYKLINHHKKIKLISSWFQTAPNPLKGYTYTKNILYGRNRKQAFLYWSVQKITKPFINLTSDVVFVNNQDEKKQFKNKHTEVLLGAVDYEKISKFKANYSKKYLAVFQGRFHPQKGVLELVDIWNKVTKEIKDAKLVMIGDGPLMTEVKKRINELKLTKSIVLTGYLFDGPQKYTYIAQSCMVVHPSLYDSGGMASAEAMAFGLPCIAYKLPSYESYYPGILNLVKYNDKDEFAEKIIYLAKNTSISTKLGKKSKEYVKNNFTWEKRAEDVLNIITSNDL